MRRKIRLAGTGLLTAALLLTGCGNNVEIKLESATNTIMKELQNFDLDIISGYIGFKEKEDKAEVSSEDTTESNEDALICKFFEDYLTECAKDMTYEIKGVDEENKTVDVSCTYVDSSDMIETFYTELIAASLTHLDGSDLTDEEVQKIEEDAVNSTDKNKTKTVDIKLHYEDEDGEYVLKEVPDELLDAGLAGLYSDFSGLSDALSVLD